MKFRPLLLLSMLILVSNSAQSQCPPGDAARAAMLPLSLENKLLAHKIVANDMEEEAPPEVGHDVLMLRKTLDIATQSFFHCNAGADSEPASLQSRLAAFLHADQSKRDGNSSAPDGVYCANLTVHVEPAKGFANSLYVVLTFDIECGDDNLLFLYTKGEGEWRQRLHWYSDKYTAPSDAFGDFFLYSVTPGPENQSLVVVAHGTPWCTSRLSGFKANLIQPATANASQKTLASTESDYSRGDTVPTLKPYSEGVTLRLDASSEDLEGVFTYVGVFRYRTVGGKLERLPVAGNVRSFVDSWFVESWAVASMWSEKPDPELQAVHNRFEYGNDEKRDVPTIHYGPVKACKSSHYSFQVEIDLTHFIPVDGHAVQKGLSPLYAHVRQNPDSFTMLAITDKPDPTCTGPDLMKKRASQPKQ